MNIRIEGDELVQQRFADERVLADPFRRMLTKSGIAGTNAAKRRARVDLGRMRASTAFEVDPAFVPVWVTIGSNVDYAAVWEHREGWLSGGLDDAQHQIESFARQAEAEIKERLEGGP